ncbi:MAG: ATP-binding protein [bacterium]|nr:ATP-binding protein [bacterium]
MCYKAYDVNSFNKTGTILPSSNIGYANSVNFGSRYLFEKMDKDRVGVVSSLVNSKLHQKGLPLIMKEQKNTVWIPHSRLGFAYQVIDYIINDPMMLGNATIIKNLNEIFKAVITFNFNPYCYMDNLEKIARNNYSNEDVNKLLAGINLYSNSNPKDNAIPDIKPKGRTLSKKDAKFEFVQMDEKKADSFARDTLNPKLKRMGFEVINTKDLKPLKYGYALQTINYLTENKVLVEKNYNSLAIVIPLIYEYMALNSPFPINKYKEVLEYLERNCDKEYDSETLYDLFVNGLNDDLNDTKNVQNNAQTIFPTTNKSSKTMITFDSVGGQERAKEMLREHIIFPINNPEVYAPIKTEKGVVISGPPGTGKSLIAQAVANECNANYKAISASLNRGSLVGESEKNWRKLFEALEKKQPAILFIDEADALCRKRGSHDVYGDSELNQFLQLMSDIEAKNLDVYVILATNNIKALDKAILRQGRFGTHITMLSPQKIEETEQIFDIHTKQFKFEDGFDKNAVLQELFNRNSTGADIAGAVKEAYLKAIKRTGVYDMMLKGLPISNAVVAHIELTNADFDEILQNIGTTKQSIGYFKK